MEFFVKSTLQFEQLNKKQGDTIRFNCLSCGKLTSFKYKPSRLENQKRLFCSICSMKDTNLKKYGVMYSSQDASIKNKISKTVIDKKGILCESEIWVNNSEEFDNIQKKTGTIIKFKCSFCGKESSFAYKRYNQEKQRRLLCTTCSRNSTDLENSIYIKNSNDITTDIKNGTVLICTCSKCNKQYKTTFRCDRIDNFKKMICSTCQRTNTTFQTYGVPYYAQTEESRTNRKSMYLYDNELFDSSWELALWIYAKDNNEEIEHEPVKLMYVYDNKEHYYYPDFKYKGVLIEIKGKQFFNKDGTMCNPYDHTQDGLFEAKHQCGLTNNVNFYREEDIKFALDYVNHKYTTSYMKLFKTDIGFPYPNVELSNTSDDGIIKHFHKSIFYATRKGKLSPLEAWDNKDLVKKSALNRLKYVGRCEPSDIVQGFNVAKIAPKISIFKPSLAKKLIARYLQSSSTIVDPFSGFSGRLLGAIETNKEYVGFDINQDHVNESNNIISYKNASSSCSVSVMDILKAPFQEYNHSSLFTCPPYGGKEHWNENNDEIELSCDEWIKVCFEKYKCDSYLFVVDKTDVFKEYIVDELVNKSHLGTNRELVLFFNSRPNL